VNAAAVLVALAIVTGCTSVELSEEERANFDQRIEEELAAGRARKARIIAENRRVLDGLARIPGSKLLAESQNAESDEDSASQTDEELEFDAYAEEKLAYEAYAEMSATGWGTFREYANPPGVSARDVYTHFLRAVRDGWRIGGTGKAVGGGGRSIYTLSLWKRGRCVWFHIGIATGAELRNEVGPGRSFEVATDRQSYQSCSESGQL
jgi:hypothetical protein